MRKLCKLLNQVGCPYAVLAVCLFIYLFIERTDYGGAMSTTAETSYNNKR